MASNNQQSNPSAGSQDQAQRPSGHNGGNPPGDGNGTPTEEVFSHQVVHNGVVCDVCDSTIVGFRYKCMQCRDYDLCQQCERRGLHAGHIMMRIAFPEMTAEALRRYIPQVENAGMPRRSCGSAPTPGDHHGRGRHGHGHGRREGWGHCGGSPSSPESSDEAKMPWGHSCPYGAGKKEFKKWAKAFKKTAHTHKKSAEAYAAQCGAEAGATGQAQNGEQANHPMGLDLSAAASQIQEVLNAFGVGIDVVELYDAWGNTSGRSNPPASQPQSSTETSAPTGTAEAGAQPNLSEQLQQMNLGSEFAPPIVDLTGPDATVPAAATTTAVPNAGGNTGNSMEVEGESGWTLLEPERSVSNPAENISIPATPANASLNAPTQIAETIIPIRIETSAPTSVPDAAAATTTTDSNPPASAPQRPMYPPLPAIPVLRPQIQQVMDGISQAVGNVTRRYGPGFHSSIPPFTQTDIQNQTPNPSSIPPAAELNEQMTRTLNQLLSMGFSNHDGWLARLVAAKNGNLDDVLNSLFPGSNEGPN